MQGGGTEDATDGDTSVCRVDVEFVSDPGLFEPPCINLRASVTSLRQVIEHLPQRHVTDNLALKSCFSFRGTHFTLPRASALAFHWLLIALALRYRLLARGDRRRTLSEKRTQSRSASRARGPQPLSSLHCAVPKIGFSRAGTAVESRHHVWLDMSDDALSQHFLDQCLMHPPCQVRSRQIRQRPVRRWMHSALRGHRSSRTGAVTGVNLKAFDQGARGRNVPHCFCQKGARQINPVSFRPTFFLGDISDEAFRANHFKHRHKTPMVFQKRANFGLKLGK